MAWLICAISLDNAIVVRESVAVAGQSVEFEFVAVARGLLLSMVGPMFSQLTWTTVPLVVFVVYR